MKKSNKKKVPINKQNKEKIKEEIRKLKVKLPEQKKLEEEKIEETNDSELEEEIEEREEAIKDNEFHELFQPPERATPRGFTSLLSKIETPEQRLEENIASTPIEKKDETSNLQNYVQSQDYTSGEAKKYQSGDTSVSRRETRGELPRRELRQQNEMPRGNVWRGWGNQTESGAEESRALPLENEEKKYKEFRLR